jgi:hypothetical protein
MIFAFISIALLTLCAGVSTYYVTSERFARKRMRSANDWYVLEEELESKDLA